MQQNNLSRANFLLLLASLATLPLKAEASDALAENVKESAQILQEQNTKTEAVYSAQALGASWVTEGVNPLQLSFEVTEDTTLEMFWEQFKLTFQKLTARENLDKADALHNGCRPVAGVINISITR